jgi:hypothetical protein
MRLINAVASKDGIALERQGSDTNSDAMASSCQMTGLNFNYKSFGVEIGHV